MRVIITEKPSVAREIASVLGSVRSGDGFILLKDGAVITWAVGHLLELADPSIYDEKLKSWELDTLPIIPNKYQLEVKKNTLKQYRIVEGLVKKASCVVIATDAGREGELIGRWILKKVSYYGAVERLWLSSMTEEEIKRGFNNLRSGKDYMRLFEAAEQRAIADWLVGINATRVYTKKTGVLLTVGRVQTPTLAVKY